VSALWSWEGFQVPHPRERLLPDGAVALVVDLKDKSSPPIVSGAHSRYFVIDTAGEMSVAGIAFTPGGAFPFLGLPAGEVQDQHVPLEALWGACAEEVRERLLGAPSASARIQILEDSLLTRVRWPLVPNPAVQFALAEFRRRERSVAEVTEQIGLSSRRFIEVFHSQVGLTPKLYCRIQRFQSVIHRIRSGAEFDWANLALDCGYFDQAHFIHDFREFSGILPTAYAREDLRHGNHVPIRD
jgi:AraC-like DNA-binding protein